MSAYTNGLAFWKHFEEKQGAIINCLKAEQYEELNELIQELDEEVMEISGAHFFVESFYDSFEMTFDTGPNKTTQYLCQMLCDIAPKSVKQNWIMNATLQPMSQKAIQAMVQIKNEEYTLADFHVFYQIENDMLDCKVYCPGFNLIGNPENKKEMSMYLMELAIGQLAYEAYICRVDFIDTPDSDMKFCQMIDFYEVIMALVEKNHWKVYDKPIDIYSVYQPIQDFAHDALRKDMKLIFTTHPLLVEQTIEEKEEVLADLSSKDGEFGYVYYSNPFHNKEDALYRQKLSKQLDETISKVHAGKVVGGAIGKSFSYIDWIVYDKDVFMKVFNQLKKQLDASVELYYQKF